MLLHNNRYGYPFFSPVKMRLRFLLVTTIVDVKNRHLH